MVHASHDGKYKWIRYAGVALDPSVKVAQQPKEVLPRREDFAAGDTESFEGARPDQEVRQDLTDQSEDRFRRLRGRP